MRPSAAEPLANGLPFSIASSTSPRQSTNVVAPAVVAEKVIVETWPEFVAVRQSGQVELQVVALDLEERRALACLLLGQTAKIAHARHAIPPASIAQSASQYGPGR